MCLMHLVIAAWLLTRRVRGTLPAVTSLLLYAPLPAISFSILFQMAVMGQPAAQLFIICVYRCADIITGTQKEFKLYNRSSGHSFHRQMRGRESSPEKS